MAMKNEFLDKINPNALKMLVKAGYEWEPMTTDFFKINHPDVRISFESVRDESLQWLKERLGIE